MLSASLVVLINLFFPDNSAALYSIKRTAGRKITKNVKKSAADPQVRNAWDYPVGRVLNLPAAPSGGSDVPFLCRNCAFLPREGKFLAVFVDTTLAEKGHKARSGNRTPELREGYTKLDSAI
jgi:hypothetical protein